MLVDTTSYLHSCDMNYEQLPNYTQFLLLFPSLTLISFESGDRTSNQLQSTVHYL
jgi:hypothetical protein